MGPSYELRRAYIKPLSSLNLLYSVCLWQPKQMLKRCASFILVPRIDQHLHYLLGAIVFLSEGPGNRCFLATHRWIYIVGIIKTVTFTTLFSNCSAILHVTAGCQYCGFVFLRTTNVTCGRILPWWELTRWQCGSSEPFMKRRIESWHLSRIGKGFFWFRRVLISTRVIGLAFWFLWIALVVMVMVCMNRISEECRW